MTVFRFLHTADVHLGKPFGGYESADRLRVARQGVMAQLIQTARTNDAAHILVAGDLFETPNPAAQTWRHAIAEMAEARDLTWWLLPGNHDNLREGGATWAAIAQLAHPNLRVLDTAQTVRMQDGVALLPAPLMTRRPTADPTAWMDDAVTSEGCLRIGLAHGSIKGFSEGSLPADIIAPDRDNRAKLDWLALGDWHGYTRVSERVAYSGAPERTGFQHNGRGVCLIVELDGPGARPRVEKVEIGGFDWQTITLDFVPGDDVAAMIEAALPQGAHRDMLIKIVATGRLALRETSVLINLADKIGPEFCHFEVEMKDLNTEIEAADLDAISLGGALRTASAALAEEAASEAHSAQDRKIAEAALGRLHALVTQDVP